MREYKICTVPRGQALVIFMFIALAILIFVGICLFPQAGWVSFYFTLIPIVAIIDQFFKHYFNNIYVTKETVRHKEKRYLWRDVYITMSYKRPTADRHSFDYVFYFNDHYLFEEEEKPARKEGFYLILNEERILLLLSLYPKRVKILTKNPHPGARYMLEMVQRHNDKITQIEYNNNA